MNGNFSSASPMHYIMYTFKALSPSFLKAQSNLIITFLKCENLIVALFYKIEKYLSSMAIRKKRKDGKWSLK
jgi:hypothetical protein